MIPGEYKLKSTTIVCNQEKEAIEMEVINVGDRPVQIGSHFHFYEVNEALNFDRERAFGMHLNIAAGTAVRFEPGDAKEVTLVEFSGDRKVFGLNNKTNGSLDGEVNR
ncbi:MULTISPECIES: urease subunit beta [Bacillaceae]|uniref:urease subunit beta n=1 Tax=Bacillales TaxID=1385 RepID=UPI001CCF6C19|nr:MULTISPECIES: urease subunit beta [Bacillaceae]MCA0173713.1 urease subunit beta [Bacillus sp. RAR_GA_16]MCA0992790.1 urease subunit beta [Pseudalkalibacillus hwajinpoensis]